MNLCVSKGKRRWGGINKKFGIIYVYIYIYNINNKVLLYNIGNPIQHPVTKHMGFPGDSVVKNLPASARDTSSIPDPGGSHIQWSN